jgi:type II secretion system protein I
MRYVPSPRFGPARSRRGITLLEVLISLAIFLFSLAAIAQLVRAASDRAVQANRRQQAIFLCQSKLAEFAAGYVPMSSQGDTAFDSDQNWADVHDWTWSADVQQNQANNVWQVAVTVTFPGSNGVQVTLTRMLLDPSARGNTMDPSSTAGTGTAGTAGTAASSAPSSSGTGSSSSGTGGGR